MGHNHEYVCNCVSAPRLGSALAFTEKNVGAKIRAIDERLSRVEVQVWLLSGVNVLILLFRTRPAVSHSQATWQVHQLAETVQCNGRERVPGHTSTSVEQSPEVGNTSPEQNKQNENHDAGCGGDEVAFSGTPASGTQACVAGDDAGAGDLHPEAVESAPATSESVDAGLCNGEPVGAGDAATSMGEPGDAGLGTRESGDATLGVGTELE